MTRLRVFAERGPDGVVRTSWLAAEAGALALVQEGAGAGPDEVLPLPPQAVLAVFARYGKPLEEAPPPRAPGDAVVPLVTAAAPAASVRAFQYRPFGWVLPADYLLLEAAGAEPLAAPAPLVCAALRALGRAASRR